MGAMTCITVPNNNYNHTNSGFNTSKSTECDLRTAAFPFQQSPPHACSCSETTHVYDSSCCSMSLNFVSSPPTPPTAQSIEMSAMISQMCASPPPSRFCYDGTYDVHSDQQQQQHARVRPVINSISPLLCFQRRTEQFGSSPTLSSLSLGYDDSHTMSPMLRPADTIATTPHSSVATASSSAANGNGKFSEVGLPCSHYGRWKRLRLKKVRVPQENMFSIIIILFLFFYFLAIWRICWRFRFSFDFGLYLFILRCCRERKAIYVANVEPNGKWFDLITHWSSEWEHKPSPILVFPRDIYQSLGKLYRFTLSIVHIPFYSSPPLPSFCIFAFLFVSFLSFFFLLYFLFLFLLLQKRWCVFPAWVLFFTDLTFHTHLWLLLPHTLTPPLLLHFISQSIDLFVNFWFCLACCSRSSPIHHHPNNLFLDEYLQNFSLFLCTFRSFSFSHRFVFSLKVRNASSIIYFAFHVMLNSSTLRSETLLSCAVCQEIRENLWRCAFHFFIIFVLCFPFFIFIFPLECVFQWIWFTTWVVNRCWTLFA